MWEGLSEISRSCFGCVSNIAISHHLINSIVASVLISGSAHVFTCQLLGTARKMWEMMLNSQDHHEAGT